MSAGRPRKEFQEYISDADHTHSSHEDYILSPATAFLKHTVEAKSAIDLVTRSLPTRQNGTFTTDSRDTLQHLILAVLPTIIGHFETYQRYLFAGVFDRTVYLENFHSEQFSKDLKKMGVEINIHSLSSYRSLGAAPVGRLISDNLPGWHNPSQVNDYFKLFGFNVNLFSNEDCLRLRTLYQIRHSIVHTGGTITLPDAQKVSTLRDFGDTQLAFEKNFIFEVSRKLHPIVRDATTRLRDAFTNNLRAVITPEDQRLIDTFFEVRSSVAVWLR